MRMRLVAAASTYPQRCAVNPVLGGRHPGGYIDTGSELPGGRDSHVYVSVVAAQEMARLLGWVAPAQVKSAEARLAQQQERISELEAQVAELEGVVDAFNVVKARKQKVKEAA